MMGWHEMCEGGGSMSVEVSFGGQVSDIAVLMLKLALASALAEEALAKARHVRDAMPMGEVKWFGGRMLQLRLSGRVDESHQMDRQLTRRRCTTASTCVPSSRWPEAS